MNLGPILIAVGAGLVLGEGFPRWLGVGAGAACVGALLIGVATVHGNHRDLTGVLLCLLTAVLLAVGVIAQKPALGRLPALQFTWLACLVGAIACLPYLPALGHQLRDAAPSSTIGLVYLGLVPTSLAFCTWAYALARTDAGRLCVTTYLVPPLTTGFGWAVLAERPAGLAVGGGLICLVGVACPGAVQRPAGVRDDGGLKRWGPR